MKAVWCDVIILDEIVFFPIHSFQDKKRNSIWIWSKLAIMCSFLSSIVFDTICGHYHIYYVIIVSSLCFHDFLPT